MNELRKETIYEKYLFPLFDKIQQFCQRHRFTLYSIAEINDNVFYTHVFPYSMFSGNYRLHPIFDYILALAECREKDGVNIDKFFLWLSKKAIKEGHSSVFLHQLGIPFQKEERKTDGETNNEHS